MKSIAVLFSLFLFSLGGAAQSYQFFNFSLTEGLCHDFAYTINQDPSGFLWVGTTQGLCRFDGKVFEQEFMGDSIPASIAFCSLFDSKERLWFGHENGMLLMLEDGQFKQLTPMDGPRSSIRAIREDSEGNIIALLQQSGLMVISPDLQVSYVGGDPGDENNPFAGKFLNNFQITAEGNLLVGSNDGLSIFRFNEELDTYIHTGDIEQLKYMVVHEIVTALHPDEFWVGTEDEGVFSLSGTGYDPGQFIVNKIGEEVGLGYARVTAIRFDGTRRVWITDYGKGIHRVELDAEGKIGNSFLFNRENGIPNEYIYQIFIDEEGNQWFSSQGNGIAVLRDQAFTFIDMWKDEHFPEISAMIGKGTDYWFGGNSKIGYYSGETEEFDIHGAVDGVPADRITALYLDSRNDLYIGTERSGLFIKKEGRRRISPLLVSGNSLENIINAIDGDGDSIFVATNNGVYTYNPVNGNRTSFSTTNGLPHNKVNDVLVDHKGIAWLAMPTSGIYGIKPNQEIKEVIIDGRPKYEFVTLAEDGNGVIWAGTKGDGVFMFEDDTLSWFNEEDGLKGDYTYAIGLDPKGYAWIGHRQGLSRIDPDRRLIRVYGKETGFASDINYNSVITTHRGGVLFGTSNGMISYDAFQAREDSIPPRLSIKSVLINQDNYDPSQPIRLKYGRYRVRIDFVGINLSNPEKVTYQYKLDGHDEVWSDVSSVPYANWSRVEDGNYNFLLKACDGNGNCSTEPVNLEISVKIPVWKAWWFIFAMVMLVLTTVFVIIKIRERNQKAIQEYLQRQLDERTREVILQKEEIEIKNRDITDSINYAQRIQASILPPIKKLHDAFSGSFVFYQPRDIVSGDFYWYEKVGENRFIVVCADSTGHGVPGAFMSMIGTTLIKDICLRSDVQKPSQVLTILDNEVRESLNQNMETSGSNDGMDIIVAEIDMKTLKFSVSSAMRPVIIYSGGEQIYVKGSRSSIGGQLDEDRSEKEFIDQEFNLNKGDIVYMFSDGYPDQFGGPLGRKFKMVRLKNLLRDIHDKPMDDQYNYIKSNFFLWKEDLEQVDDVLFMGIKL
ncbi:MAG: SpoIIE family protein phosphatase [Bacteroidetes bacterium]|nr:SpoIIE family protein phosphatase [Bacteroidota bacterium]